MTHCSPVLLFGQCGTIYARQYKAKLKQHELQAEVHWPKHSTKQQ